MSRRLLAAVLALVTAACADTGETSPTSVVALCEEPPANEVTSESDLEMRVSPSPAAAGDVVELTVLRSDLPDDSVVGVDAEWQCWDGTKWATTHIVYRGFGDNAGQTIPVNPAFQIQVPSIGLDLHAEYPIVIPVVEPGTYRIRDEILVERSTITGFTLVDVVDG
jgi:hypothetical protein